MAVPDLRDRVRLLRCCMLRPANGRENPGHHLRVLAVRRKDELGTAREKPVEGEGEKAPRVVVAMSNSSSVYAETYDQCIHFVSTGLVRGVDRGTQATVRWTVDEAMSPIETQLAQTVGSETMEAVGEQLKWW